MEEKCTLIENETVDLILTDPPYNISTDIEETPYLNWSGNTVHRIDFDHESQHKWDQISREQYIKQLNEWSSIWCEKLRKNGQFYIFVGDRYISDLWFALENVGLSPKRIITWRKPNAVPFNRKALFISSCEYIIWGTKEFGKGNHKKTFNASPNINKSETSIIEREVLVDKISNIIQKTTRKIHENTPPILRSDVELMVETILKQSKEEIITSLNKLRPDEKSYEKSVLKAEKVFEERKNKAIEHNKTIPTFKPPETFDDKLRLIFPNEVNFPSLTGKRIHPTEKPVELLKYFISISTNENDTILDTFGGSGSTANAAKELGRNSITIEREELYYSKILERLSA
jgi:DNA modification methylase